MPATPDELFAYLDSLGVAHQTVSHPAVFTVEEARTLRGRIAGGHTKNLFLRDKKGALFLVVAPEDAMIELKSLHRLLGASGRFSFGSAALMRETLGVEPGSVTPFAVINDKAGQVTVILDAAMMAHETLNFTRWSTPARRRSRARASSSFSKRPATGRRSSRFRRQRPENRVAFARFLTI